jgi:hypothetical protein
MTGSKRCPRCGQVRSADQFYRRRGGRRLSPYWQPCTRTASRAVRTRRRQDPDAAEALRTVDRARQRRRRTLDRQGGEEP